jgi:hypothetical protein
MALTKTQVETVLLGRCGGKMGAAGMNVSTLAEPMAWALSMIGHTPADPTTVTDTDLANVEPKHFLKLFDLAELRTLKNIQGNLDTVNISVGPRTEQLNQLYEQVDKAITRLQLFIAGEYGIGLGSLTGGTISLDFQEEW